jgi:hypothetical protein
MSLPMNEFQIQSRILTDPAGNLDPADIFADRMMGARFQNKDAASGLQTVYGFDSAHELFQIPYGQKTQPGCKYQQMKDLEIADKVISLP